MNIFLTLSILLTISYEIVKCQNDVDLKGGVAVKNEFLTFDGLSYKFNGFGEYTFFEIIEKNFISQIRMTQLTNSNGENILASGIISLAIKSKDADSIQIDLNNNKNDNEPEYLLYINGQLYNQFENNLNGIIIELDSNIIRFEYISIGITFDVRVSKRRDSLMIVVAIPNIIDFQSKTRGLLGVMDDDSSNDLTFPNGFVFNYDLLNDKSIFMFGQQWRTTEDKSIFKYFNSKTFSNYINLYFIPKFMIDGISFGDNIKLENDANNFCKENNYKMDKCLFEISVSNELGFTGADFTDEYLNNNKEPRFFSWLWRNVKRVISIIPLRFTFRF